MARFIALQMIVTCPDCTTRYLVDPRSLGSAGRVVRCAHCGKTWHQTPPEDFPLSLDVPIAEPAPTPAETRPQQLPALPQRRGMRWATIGWIVLLVAVLSGAVAVSVVERDEVIAMWPPAERLYKMVGRPTTPTWAGLQLRNTTPVSTTENGVKTLVIERSEERRVGKECRS